MSLSSGYFLFCGLPVIIIGGIFLGWWAFGAAEKGVYTLRRNLKARKKLNEEMTAMRWARDHDFVMITLDEYKWLRFFQPGPLPKEVDASEIEIIPIWAFLKKKAE